MKMRALALLLSLALLITGCAGQNPGFKQENTGISSAGKIDTSNLFTDRDQDGSYTENGSVAIQLNGNSITGSANSVQVSGTTATITKEGTYILSGTLDDGMIIVNAPKTDKIQLVLKDATIHSATCAPIYVQQADKVFVTLAEGSNNTLSNGGTFTAIDDNNIDAVIFSKEDLTLNGAGALTVSSPAGHGIVSKDELTVTGGSYTVTSASHGLSGKDNICIQNATFDIASGKDGIHGENQDDTALGFVYIAGGNFTVRAEGDGISASSQLQIDGGVFSLVTGGGSTNAEKDTSDSWGDFGGGGFPGGRPGGNKPGGMMGGSFGGSTSAEEEDSTSIKGTKAGGDLLINGGTFTIDAADDAVHSNANLTVNGGEFAISTGDDGFHADKALLVAAGTIAIEKSYEGLEGLTIDVSGGDISIVSQDDGLNAAGGRDQSGFGGRPGDLFGSASSSDSYIHISGGTLFINASGDGIDSNGTLRISGGSVTVSGPTSGDTTVLDFDTTGVITGGTFIGTGSQMMAQTFTQSENQGVIAVRVGNQSVETQITLTDKAGNTLISYTPNLPFAIVILSSPDMVKGETYTITVGTVSETFEAS